MYRLLLLFFSLASTFSLSAQQLSGQVTDETGEALLGATLSWLNTGTGTSTDLDGRFEIAIPANDNPQLIVSYVGYATDTLSVAGRQVLEIVLRADNQLETVVVSEREQGSFISTVNPIKSDVLTEVELRKGACCDLAGCFNTQASVHANTTNVVTNAKELRILGLSGVYNQVLINGLPLIQGLSYTYGISGIPGTLVERIYVAKGANSVLQGFESISGQINVILKAADKANPLLLNVYANSFGERQLNANYAKRWNRWSTLLAVHTTQAARRVDGDGDTFMDVPLVTRYSAYNNWRYRNPSEWGWHSNISLRYVNEERLGGQMDFVAESTNSPRAYGQTVSWSQPELSVKTGYRFDDTHHIVASAAGFYQQQHTTFGPTSYDAQQANGYANLQYERNWSKQHRLKMGGSIRWLDLDETIELDEEEELGRTYAGNYRKQEQIAGWFAENTWQWLDGKVVLITGFRMDHHNDFGWKTTPRALLKYNVSPNTTIRASAGSGWRTANIWSENVNLLASSREVQFVGELLPEDAINYGVNLTHTYVGTSVEAQLSLDAYRTTFQNQIFPDYNQDARLAVISNFDGPSISNGLQAELGLQFFDRLGLKMAYNYLDVYREMDQEKVVLPFNAKHRSSGSLSYQPLGRSWQWDANLHWYGEQVLASNNGSPDEFQQAERSESYFVTGTQVTKRWTKLELYFGCENIFSFRQNFPIRSWQDPFGPFFDTANVWGPTRGREFYLGLRYELE